MILYNCCHYSDNQDAIEEIASMPGQARYGVNKLVEALREPVSNGLESVLLFGVPTKLPKVSIGSHLCRK